MPDDADDEKVAAVPDVFLNEAELDQLRRQLQGSRGLPAQPYIIQPPLRSMPICGLDRAWEAVSFKRWEST